MLPPWVHPALPARRGDTSGRWVGPAYDVSGRSPVEALLPILSLHASVTIDAFSRAHDAGTGDLTPADTLAGRASLLGPSGSGPPNPPPATWSPSAVAEEPSGASTSVSWRWDSGGSRCLHLSRRLSGLPPLDALPRSSLAHLRGGAWTIPPDSDRLGVVRRHASAAWLGRRFFGA